MDVLTDDQKAVLKVLSRVRLLRNNFYLTGGTALSQFYLQQLMPIEEIIPLAKQKHVGLDEYWLARAMFQVKNITFLPRMIKSLSVDELKDFFLKKAEGLIEKGS